MNDIGSGIVELDLRAATSASSLTARPEDVQLRQPMEGVFARLWALIDARGGIVVQVTSATEGEGSSTIARGLAAAAARTDWCRTALIDASPAPTCPVALRDAPPVLLDHATPGGKPLLRREIIDGVVVDTGLLRAADAGAPSAERLRWMLTALRNSYELTVLDCPPVTTAPNLAAMSRRMDGVILVVAAERVRSTTVVQACGQLEQFGANILGVVLNKRRERLPRFLARWF